MGIGIKELLIILAIALLIFGTKKLKNLGPDLGGAIKGFKNAMKDGEKAEDAKDAQQLADNSKDADFSATDKTGNKTGQG